MFMLIILSLVLIFVVRNDVIIPTSASDSIIEKSRSSSRTIIAEDLILNDASNDSMEFNTSYLQNLIDLVSNEGGGTVYIPSGTYYFSSGGNNLDSRKTEYYVIKCRDNVTIEGAGTSESSGTILMPVGSHELPLDMFYYNDYRDTYGADTDYLINADFKDFVIDGKLATSTGGYNTAGKGFMINLYKDCDWDNVVVKNTDGTGFGMDNPINSTITNCMAIGCGKAATSSDYGASGFGIGTGYSEDESIVIKNCKAMGNRKYGFFFEHQGRFSSSFYSAMKSKGFIVDNCTASGNLYNFGGERANDVTYKNCKSYEVAEENPLNIVNASAIHFTLNSRRITIENCEINQEFADVTDSTKYYYDAVYWALNNGIVEGGTSNSMFNPTDPCTRAQALTLLWRMAGYPGEVVIGSASLNTGYADVSSNSWYTDSVYWAKEAGIISDDTYFYPANNCTKANFLTMLWRYTGEPKATLENNFNDVDDGRYYKDAVDWAVSERLIHNTPNTDFLPNESYTRAEVITILYRYANGINVGSDNIDSSSNNNSSDNNSSSNSNNSNSSNNSSNNSCNSNSSSNSSNSNSNNSNSSSDNIDVLSNNNYLKELYLTKGVLKFDKDQSNYEVIVPYNIDKLEIIGTPYNDKVIVEGLGEKELVVGDNNFTIKVIAENKEERYYYITIIRNEEDDIILDDNNYLKILSIERYDIDFRRDKYNYEIVLDDNSTSLDITAVPYSDKADVTIVGNEDLTVGSSVKILVTAENADTEIYTITIIEEGDKYSILNLGPVIILLVLFSIVLAVVLRKRYIKKKSNIDIK